MFIFKKIVTVIFKTPVTSYNLIEAEPGTYSGFPFRGGNPVPKGEVSSHLPEHKKT